MAAWLLVLFVYAAPPGEKIQYLRYVTYAECQVAERRYYFDSKVVAFCQPNLEYLLSKK